VSARIGRILLALGDGIALTLFAVFGLLRHQEGLAVGGVARNAGPILVGWYATALALGLYRRPGRRRLVATWAIGVSAGVVIRALILGRSADASALAFWAVTLAVTLVLLSAWRLTARALSLRSPGTSPSRPASGSSRPPPAPPYS
jgi:hypothetical protein